MNEKKTKTRPYLLKNKSGTERIVQATSQQQAIFHAARTEWEVAPLTTNDALRLAATVKVEIAGEIPTDGQQGLPLAATNSDPAADFVANSGLGG